MPRIRDTQGVDIARLKVMPPPFIRERDPLPTDYKPYEIGQQWINTATSDIFELASKSGGTSTWVQIGDSTGELHTLTGNSGSATPTSGSINLAGGTNITSSATGSTVTHSLNSEITLNSTSSTAAQINLQRNNLTCGQFYGTRMDITDTYQNIIGGSARGLYMVFAGGVSNDQPVGAWIIGSPNNTGAGTVTPLISVSGAGTWSGKSLSIQWTAAGVPQIKHDNTGVTMTSASLTIIRCIS